MSEIPPKFVTELQVFEAMITFLEDCYKKDPSDDLKELIEKMKNVEEPLLCKEWIEAVQAVESGDFAIEW